MFRKKWKAALVNGINDISNRPEFTHVNFAEYLAASYLWRQFRTIKYEQLEQFVNTVIIETLIKKLDRKKVFHFFKIKAQKPIRMNDNELERKNNTIRTLLYGNVPQFQWWKNNRVGKQVTQLHIQRCQMFMYQA